MNEQYLLSFGKRVRELRMKTGLSQEKFALKIEMERTYFALVTLLKYLLHQAPRQYLFQVY